MLYLDCFSGVAGDMFVGALLALGLELSDLEDDLSGLGLGGYRLRAGPVHRGPLTAVDFGVEVEPGQPARDHAAIAALLAAARLPDGVAEAAARVFDRLAEAEAAVHGVPVERVHFHEVGGVDAIVDVVGACAALARLGWPRLVVGPLPLGSGTVETSHGTLPVPAPATALLARGLAIAPPTAAFEQTTPTGAALVATLGASGPLPSMTVEAVGCGAGDRQGDGLPNVLRAWLGRAAAAPGGLWVLECQVDDLTGELAAALVDDLLAAGARDAWTVPIQMKKGRPGLLVGALAGAERVEVLTDRFFEASSTFGVRRHPVERVELAREWCPVQTEHGEVRMKVGRHRGRLVTASPEHDDCVRAAESAAVSVRAVHEAARASWARRQEPPRGEAPR